MKKAIVATWLTKTTLSNLNAGEGSSNLKEIKSYANGLPYISGQSNRHSLRKAIQRENPDKIKCTVEAPCGVISECWLCDMFGYLKPKGTKRWSPIKMSPSLGMIKQKVTTDLILRLVNDIECPNCKKKINPYTSRGKDKEGKTVKEIKMGSKLDCPKCSKQFEAPYDIRQAIAYKQLIENTYNASMSIDVNALGVEEIPIIENDIVNGINYSCKYGNEAESERKTRVTAILKALSNISDYASISREMTNTTPDVIMLAYQDEFNNRLASALQLDKEGNLDIDRCKSILLDVLTMNDSKVFIGTIHNTFSNQEEFESMIEVLYNNNEEKVIIKDTPREAINELIKLL